MSCHQIVQYPLRDGTVRQLLTLTGLKGRRGNTNAPAFQIHLLVKAIQKANVSGQARENSMNKSSGQRGILLYLLLMAHPQNKPENDTLAAQSLFTHSLGWKKEDLA